MVNLGVTHVVNAAGGKQHIDTGAHFYADTDILYHEVEATDCKDFDLCPFFTKTSDFIHGALSQKGKSQFVLVKNNDNKTGNRYDLRK